MNWRILFKVKKQHEAAVDYLHKITPFEDKLLTLEWVVLLMRIILYKKYSCWTVEDSYA